ncbi:hypothetical protein OPKNFCMD_5697 [Methylobacterium crusticola]|uniref:Uncharacterized protein n=1 Tax=Methylobacterium crusticola TaxID=1697972 RepID=A0ABQ4R6Z0_9HYPH|nr:hypothetical protein OPKNFCMD_5697 [Methylobacterium crusticola]
MSLALRRAPPMRVAEFFAMVRARPDRARREFLDGEPPPGEPPPGTAPSPGRGARPPGGHPAAGRPAAGRPAAGRPGLRTRRSRARVAAGARARRGAGPRRSARARGHDGIPRPDLAGSAPVSSPYAGIPT